MRALLLIAPVLTLFLLSCERNENFPEPTTPSTGGGPRTPTSGNTIPISATDWRFFVGDVGNRSNPNNYQQSVRTSSVGTTSPIGGTGLAGVPARAVSFTLGMGTSTLVDTTSYCYWTYRFTPPAALRVGRSLTLTAKVRLEQVQGQGVSLVLRGDRNSQPSVLFATTEGKTPVKGTADFAEYAVTLPYSAGVDELFIYLILLPHTTGTATFTDVSLAIH
ncbi:hypothetical protein GCM10027299_28670 [Larkinella ripae]